LETIKRSIIAILMVISGCIFVVSVIAAIVLNSGMLNRYAHDQIVDLFNDEYFGRLELQDVTLQFPNRVTLLKPSIYEPGAEAPAIAAKRIRLRFNFLMLLQPEIRRLSFRRIAADSLSAAIIEREDGKLNIERIFSSRKPDSSRAPIESFFCKKISVSRGSISLLRKTTGKPPVEYRSENIDLGIADLRIKDNLFGGVLEKGSFSLPSHRFSLEEASGTFHFSPSRSELLAFKARSGRSNAELSVSLDDFDLFKEGDEKQFVERLKTSRSFVNIHALNLHTEDLKIFLPELRLPDGIYRLKGDAKLSDGTLEVFDSRISYGKSRLSLKGEVRRIRSDNDMTFKAVCDSSTIEPVFFKTFLRDTAYESLAEQLGAVSFFGRAEGSQKQAETAFTLMTESARSPSMRKPAETSINSLHGRVRSGLTISNRTGSPKRREEKAEKTCFRHPATFPQEVPGSKTSNSSRFPPTSGTPTGKGRISAKAQSRRIMKRKKSLRRLCCRTAKSSSMQAEKSTGTRRNQGTARKERCAGSTLQSPLHPVTSRPI